MTKCVLWRKIQLLYWICKSRCVPSHCNCIVTFEKVTKSIVLLLRTNEEGITETYSGTVTRSSFLLLYTALQSEQS